jgi:hypothetical protein
VLPTLASASTSFDHGHKITSMENGGGSSSCKRGPRHWTASSSFVADSRDGVVTVCFVIVQATVRRLRRDNNRSSNRFPTHEQGIPFARVPMERTLTLRNWESAPRNRRGFMQVNGFDGAHRSRRTQPISIAARTERALPAQDRVRRRYHGSNGRSTGQTHRTFVPLMATTTDKKSTSARRAGAETRTPRTMGRVRTDPTREPRGAEWREPLLDAALRIVAEVGAHGHALASRQGGWPPARLDNPLVRFKGRARARPAGRRTSKR